LLIIEIGSSHSLLYFGQVNLEGIMSKGHLQLLLDFTLIVIFLGLVFLSISLSLGVPEFARYFELLFGSDKVLHFFAGSVITFSVFRTLFRLLTAKYINTLFFSMALSILILIIDEFSQLTNSYRQFDIYDLTAGLMGLTFTAILLMIINKLFMPLSNLTAEQFDSSQIK
jgi:hypothetical protein